MKITGLGFKQFKNDDGSWQEKPLWTRFIEASTGQQIGDASPGYDLDDEQFFWKTPPAPLNTQAIM